MVNLVNMRHTVVLFVYVRKYRHFFDILSCTFRPTVNLTKHSNQPQQVAVSSNESKLT